jgi:beta-glucosidase
MLDGNTATRWSTGTPMANGQSITLDMGSAQNIDQIVMDSAGSTNDYAHGYQVFTSTDGTNFGTAVATGAGTAAKVTVTFPATTARYVKVVQTGTSTSWWSIAELNVYTNGTTTGGGGTGAVLPRTGWVASASATGGGDIPANALDGNTGTRWSTGTPMVNGQTFSLDLGSAQAFSKLTMDSAGSASDYAHGYQVFVSTDGTNFGTAIATGAGTAALVTVTFPTTTARYVKIVQTGSSTSWWSIAEVNLYS